jgi:GDPmannose 4,6-dehydratase
LAFASAGLPVTWEGAGLNQRAIDPDGRVVVRIDPRYFRPTEVDSLQGDYSKAERQLGWRPKTKFHELVQMMVQADLREVARRKTL